MLAPFFVLIKKDSREGGKRKYMSVSYLVSSAPPPVSPYSHTRKARGLFRTASGAGSDSLIELCSFPLAKGALQKEQSGRGQAEIDERIISSLQRAPAVSPNQLLIFKETYNQRQAGARSNSLFLVSLFFRLPPSLLSF